jgi:hypothetical protein
MLRFFFAPRDGGAEVTLVDKKVDKSANRTKTGALFSC